MWMFDQLRDRYHKVWLDNLHMSAFFAKQAWNHERCVMVAGVAWTSGRGVPSCVLQETVKTNQLPTTRCEVKAAVLQGDSKCPDLIGLSIYDNKPVHFISMIAESIKWIVKCRKVWNRQLRQCDTVNFLRVNVNNDYNHKMNPVDVADQLRNNCRMDHWIRQRKWW